MVSFSDGGTGTLLPLDRTKRQDHWTRLEALLERGRAGVARLAHNELRELALLYRQTAADLSTAREDRANAQLAAYLNQLLGRAHNLMYAAAAPVDAERRRLLRADLSTDVSRRRGGIRSAATALFLIGALAGAVMSLADPGFQRFVLGRPDDGYDRSSRDVDARHRVGEAPGVERDPDEQPERGAGAFALGAPAGLGTIYMMFFNGLLIAVIGTACYRAGMNVPLWSFVAPHGVARAAGDLHRRRRRSIAGPRGSSTRSCSRGATRSPKAAAASIRLLLGVFPLLIVAGLIEGFVSPIAIRRRSSL